MGEILNEPQVVLVAEIFLPHITHEVVDVSLLIDRGRAENYVIAFRLNIVGGPNIVHAADMRKQEIILEHRS